jgi:dTDP-4-dehydrorhamnose 3,5-epimerase-like enzyme
MLCRREIATVPRERQSFTELVKAQPFRLKSEKMVDVSSQSESSSMRSVCMGLHVMSFSEM